MNSSSHMNGSARILGLGRIAVGGPARMPGRRVVLAAVAAALSGAVAARPAVAQPAARRRPLGVLSTVGMIGDLVSVIGGTRVNGSAMMGEGVDPHLYRPTRTDIARLLAAEIVFYNGLLLEGKMTDALVRAANAGRRVVAVTERLPRSFLLRPPEAHGEDVWDPHVWMDPTAWAEAAVVIADTLSAADPAGAGEFAAGLARIRATIAGLDTYAQSVLGSVPARQRVLVTAHDAFHYFARRYAYRVEGIQGISTESEAGVRRIEELVALLAEQRVPAVFVESSVPERNVRALIEGAAARGHRVSIGGTLYSDAMGAPGTYEGTYPGMIDHNVTTIARALGGAAPPRGQAGRLAAAG